MSDKRPPRRPKKDKHAYGPRRFEADDDAEVRIFGLHAVEAALANPARKILSATATENAANKLAEALRARGIEPARASPRDLDRLLGADTVHQGALLVVEPLTEPSLAQLAGRARDGHPIVVLDQVTDPHNVGAVLRSGAVFGCGGLVMTRRHSPPLGGVLAKSASGGLEHVPVALVTNLARALAELKDEGVLAVGLEGTADKVLHEEIDATRPLAIVLGAEGKGLRQLTAETCDRLCRIETAGALASLNVSNAAAIALHLIAMHRR